MNTTRLSVFLQVLLLCSASIGHSQESPFPVLTVPVFFHSELPDDMQAVNDAVNELVRDKIGAEIELVPMLFITAFGKNDIRILREVEMIKKEGKYFDVLPSILPETEFIQLDGLLEEYGTDILRMIEPYKIESSRKDGILRSLPTMNDFVASAGITMRKDLIDIYRIDLSNVRTFEDMDPVYEFLRIHKPEMYMICGYQTNAGLLYRHKSARIDSDSVFIQDESDPARIINFYGSDFYAGSVRIFREWFLKGYISKKWAFQNVFASDLVKAGELFSYVTAYKPGIEHEASTNCGMEMITIPIMEPVISRNMLEKHQWGISVECEFPEKAMQFLNLLYSDAELVNLIVFGIEGVHYTVHQDGTLGPPEIKSAENAAYFESITWLLPNELITKVWEGNDSDVWERTRAFNNDARISEAISINISDPNILERYAEFCRIVNTYGLGLETGQIDPDIYLPLMLQELEDAGLENIRKVLQSQLDTIFHE